MAESTVTGFMQIGINQTKTTAATTSTTTNLEDSNANTVINFTDVEDLGDGIKATTVIGINPQLSGFHATGVYTGQTTYFALSGAFGELKAGTFGNDQFWTIVAGDSTGYMGTNAAAVNNAIGASGAATNWTSNQIRYQLPTIATGLTLAYTAKLSDTATTTDGSGGTQTVFGAFTTGGFNVQAAASQYKYSSSVTDTLSSVAVSYDFGVAKLYALSTSTKIGGTATGAGTVTGSNIGVSAPVGAFTFMYNNASANGNLNAHVITAVDQSSQDLGFTYAFSKKTTAWVLFTKYNGNSVAQQGNGNTAAGAVSGYGFDSMRVMLTHAF